MPKLDDNTLLNLLNNYEAEARSSLSTRLSRDNETAKRYNAELYGNEIEGHSEVVSEDVKDTIESDMPSLIRTILNSGPICKFQVNNPDNERDVKEAQEKTDFADFIVRNQPDSFKINYDFIKSVDMFKCGAIKYMVEDEDKAEVEVFENVPDDGLLELDEMIRSTPFFDSYETKSTTQNEDGTTNYKIKIFTKREEIILVPVPRETLLISNGASSVDEANMVGDISTKSRGELLAAGFPRKLVAKLSTSQGNQEGSSARSIRFDDEGNVEPKDYGEWANQHVEIIDMYALVDYDQDGIAERRHIIKSGDFILENELFNHVPYAIASAIMIPHSVVGEGRGSQVENIAKVKTSLERGLLDNLYGVNNPEIHINDNVNQEDLFTDDINKVVRHKGDTIPANNIQGIEIPFIGDKALLGLQHMDQKKARLVGNQITNQGLNADDVNNETATRFKGIEKAEAAKLELVIRLVAEVGYRKLYEGVVWMAQRYLTRPISINSQGKSISIDPSKWMLDSRVNVEIGLGTGNNEETVGNLTALWQIHSQLKAEQSPLTDEVKRYNVLNDLTKALELKDTSRYFNNPEEPDELLRAQNEQLNTMVLQLQQQMQILQQQLDNPLAEAEMVKREGDIAIAQGKLALDTAKLQENQRQFNIKTAQDQDQHNDDIAVDLTKIQADENKVNTVS